MPLGQELERAPVRTGHYREHFRYEGIRNGLMKQVGGDVTLRDVGPGAEDRWDFLDALDAESPVRQVLTGPLITFISSERTVVHARNTGGVLSGQRAAIRSRLSGLAASAPGRTARGSPGRH